MNECDEESLGSLLQLSESAESGYYYDSLMYEDVHTSKSGEGKATRKSLLCCFCPPTLIDNDDESECYNDKDILRNVNMSTDDKEDDEINLVISVNIPGLDADSLDAVSVIDEDEFLSCCDSRGFDSDLSDDSDLSHCSITSSTQVTPTANVPFTRYVRICDINVANIEHQPASASLMDIDDGSEVTTDGNKCSEIKFVSIKPSTKTAKFIDLTNNKANDTGYRSEIQRITNIMTTLGLNMAYRNLDEDDNTLITWKAEKSTASLINQVLDIESKNWSNNAQCIGILEKDILIWTGAASTNPVGKTQGLSAATNYGSKIPLFKARGIIPNMSPLALNELILDSSRVKLYNKWSNGRIDVHVFQDKIDIVNGLFGHGCSKVTQSEVNIPFTKKTIKIANFLHSRRVQLQYDDLCRCDGSDDSDAYDPLHNSKAFIIVSRSTFNNEQKEQMQSSDAPYATLGGTDEVLWSVNIMREVPGHPDKTDLTTVTQANSSALPTFLAHKVSF
jgi:hypothetical protein